LTIERSKSAPPDLHTNWEPGTPWDGSYYGEECQVYGHEFENDSGNVRTKCIHCYKDFVRDPVTGNFTHAFSPCLHTRITSENDLIVCDDCHQSWENRWSWIFSAYNTRYGLFRDIMPCYQSGGHHKPRQLLGRTQCVTCQQPIVRDTVTRIYELIKKKAFRYTLIVDPWLFKIMGLEHIVFDSPCPWGCSSQSPCKHTTT
jgi:hypothetical protein